MIADSVYLKNQSCFKHNFVGFDCIKKFNIVIGKNNAGKSKLISFVNCLCMPDMYANGQTLMYQATLHQENISSIFMDTTGGILHGNHKTKHGEHLVGMRIKYTVNDKHQLEDFSIVSGEHLLTAGSPGYEASRLNHIKDHCPHTTTVLNGTVFRRLSSDRDIEPEPESDTISLTEKGVGATNIIRKLTTVTSKLNNKLIPELLQALNAVFAPDSRFTQISASKHEDSPFESKRKLWEIYLHEDGKGSIPLSDSGSGLKTILLVLINLLIIPKLKEYENRAFTFAFEELENNLHPYLLRKLFNFLSQYINNCSSRLFVTTHSSIVLDMYGCDEKTHITHIARTGECAITSSASSSVYHFGVMTNIGARPSDILQANGIVWLEGPSDRVYFNSWINLLSGGDLREGKDYQCAFYGGALLSHFKVGAIEDPQDKLVNLLHLCRNLVIICDSDKKTAGNRLKARVEKFADSVRSFPGPVIWITKAKEIENYLSGEAISKAFHVSCTKPPAPFERFWPKPKSPGESFYEKIFKRRGYDKVVFAQKVAPCIELGQLRNRFDWLENMNRIVDSIKKWNC